MQGWISIHRKIKNNWLYKDKPFCKSFAWIDLLLSTNHCEAKINVGNQLVTVLKGSFITSEIKLSEKWGWSRKKVRSFLLVLERDGMLTKNATTKYTTITIDNWDSYQIEGQQKEHQTHNKGTTKEQQRHTNNNDNNVDNENKKSFCPESDEVKLSLLLFEKMKLNNPTCKEPNIQTWAESIDKLIRIDKKPVAEIVRIIEWSQKDTFWHKNILSTEKLRKKFDELLLKAKPDIQQKLVQQTAQYREE